MGKIAIISDTHLGVRSDSPAFLAHAVSFFRRQFFPALERLGVDSVVHLGDLVDRRRYVNYHTAETLRKEFLEPLSRYDSHVLCGNHDAFHRNTNETNALRELVMKKYENVKIYTNPAMPTISGLPVALVPWICDHNRDVASRVIAQAPAPVLMGHLELAGFRMYRSSSESHGDDPAPLSRFKRVLSGHYHHRSTKGNVTYVGAPYEMTWADAGDDRGFHIMDTETLALDFHRNGDGVHVKVHYSDGVEPLEDLPEGLIWKVVVSSREDGLAFDRFVRAIENSRPADVQVVEDHLNLNRDLSEDEPDEAISVEETSVALRRAVEELDGDVDKEALSSLLSELYSEALVRR